jgi:hypothetical protein
MKKNNVIFGSIVVCVTSATAIFSWKWVHQYQQNADRIHQIPLGAPRERFIADLGKPVRRRLSQDGRFERLEFHSPPVHDVVLAATIEVPTGSAIQVLENEHSVRTMPGFEQLLNNETKWREQTDNQDSKWSN